ncbi:MAG TPA: hypothetical protein VIN04_11235 [Myxococcota bacterium]
MRESIRRAFLRAAAFAAAAAFTGLAHAALPEGSTDRSSELGDRWVPDPEVARVAALGFENVVSDYHWLLALQIVGGSRIDPSHYGAVLAKLVEVVTRLDPWVDHPYRFAALWLTDSLASARRADAILERGIAYHPREWRNRFYQGVHRFLFLEDEQGAADSFEGAMRLPGAPGYLPRLVARLRAGGAGLDVAAAMLERLLEEAEDPYERAGYELSLREIETERRARLLDAARAEFQRRNGRDIVRVDELVQGPGAVLRALPPEPNQRGWTIDAETGRIVSTYYGRRYEPFVHPAVREEQARLRAESRNASGEGRS